MADTFAVADRLLVGRPVAREDKPGTEEVVDLLLVDIEVFAFVEDQRGHPVWQEKLDLVADLLAVEYREGTLKHDLYYFHFKAVSLQNTICYIKIINNE